MSDIPITYGFNQGLDGVLGYAQINSNSAWEIFKENPEAFTFEPGYIKNEDGTVELIEISLVPRAKNQSMALSDLIDDLS